LYNLIRRLAGVLARPPTAAWIGETAPLRFADVSPLHTAVPGKSVHAPAPARAWRDV